MFLFVNNVSVGLRLINETGDPKPSFDLKNGKLLITCLDDDHHFDWTDRKLKNQFFFKAELREVGILFVEIVLENVGFGSHPIASFGMERQAKPVKLFDVFNY